MDLELQDKICLVTGSSRGIGLAIATGLLAEGARVVLTGRTVDDLDRAAAELGTLFDSTRVLSIPGDLSQSSHATSVLDSIQTRWGPIDCLVANVGSGRSTPGWDITRDDWNRAFDANLWPTVQLMPKVIQCMKAKKGGSIVVIDSIAGMEALSAPLAYAAAKAGLLNYAKNLSRQVAEYGIRVNSIAPGNVLFPGGSWERHLAERYDEVMGYVRTEVPLQRFGNPREIADAAAFLLSNRASFITGACLVVDGGQVRSI
jgi:3-oxoacyl-[acyl-carrier protein] reductase